MGAGQGAVGVLKVLRAVAMMGQLLVVPVWRCNHGVGQGAAWRAQASLLFSKCGGRAGVLVWRCSQNPGKVVVGCWQGFFLMCSRCSKSVW